MLNRLIDDLRFIVGALFGIFAVILLSMAGAMPHSAVAPASDAIAAAGLGAGAAAGMPDLNLGTGLVMLGFAAVMIGLAVNGARQPAVVEVPVEPDRP